MQAAYEVARCLYDAGGYQAFFAGGCVRDALMGRICKDIDIATSALPDEVERIFPGMTVSVGKSFGVIQVLHKGFAFDVATFRADGVYEDGRHPRGFTPTSVVHDAQRRDFTINGLFYDPRTGECLDFVEGMADLESRVIRAIGDPTTRFQEDHLRMLRAVRFASVLGFEVVPGTLAAVAANAPLIRKVSIERVATELNTLLRDSPQPSKGLELLRKTNLLRLLLPEIEAMYGTRQPPQYHPEGDVWTHTTLMLDSSPFPRSPALAWSILLHDVGKPATIVIENVPGSGASRVRFPNHAPVGARMAEEILIRLRQPSSLVREVVQVVADHMRLVDAARMRTARLRRLLGAAHFPTLLEVVRLDTLHSRGGGEILRFVEDVWRTFQCEPVLPPPLVRGRDLLGWGVSPGPRMGALLRELYDAQLEGRISTLQEAHRYLAQCDTETAT